MHAGIYRDINDNLVLVQETVDGHFLISHQDGSIIMI